MSALLKKDQRERLRFFLHVADMLPGNFRQQATNHILSAVSTGDDAVFDLFNRRFAELEHGEASPQAATPERSGSIFDSMTNEEFDQLIQHGEVRLAAGAVKRRAPEAVKHPLRDEDSFDLMIENLRHS